MKKKLIKEIDKRLNEIRKVLKDENSSPPNGSFELGMYRGESWQLRSLKKFINTIK